LLRLREWEEMEPAMGPMAGVERQMDEMGRLIAAPPEQGWTN
jgi:hypothetical protein